ncbi:MAG: class I SAM-dependent methyltransferase [Candidatus Heimdallarchaeota archaeon]|nr:MAG: class I SAM-dependent methyltransferase [Candidatus Heimdallarchaeota archaeon]
MNTRLQHVCNIIPRKLDGLKILDCGIGFGEMAFRLRTHYRFRGTPFIVGLDLHESYVLLHSTLGLYDKVYNCSVIDIPYAENFFDIVLALELIEHLSKEDGLKMLNEVERVSRGQVIITTPHGFTATRERGGNPHMEHISGWHPKDFTDRGYSVRLIDPRMMTRSTRLVDNVRRAALQIRRIPKTILAVKKSERNQSYEGILRVDDLVPIIDK